MLQLTKKYPRKRAFITGAASGLGRALALQLAADGWTIGITDLSRELLQPVTAEIERHGGKTRLYAFDVSRREKFQEAAAKFLAAEGGIDLLINNAGVGDGGQFHTYDLERWDWIIGINQMGVIYGCHYFLPVMRQAKSGHIINIASAAGFAYAPAVSGYNVTKAAVNALSETLYHECRPLGVRVSVVMPTFFKTNIIQGWRGSERSRKAAEQLVNNSGLEAETVAAKVLKQAGRGHFRIVLPFRARFLYFMVRFFPRLYRRTFRF